MNKKLKLFINLLYFISLGYFGIFYFNNFDIVGFFIVLITLLAIGFILLIFTDPESLKYEIESTLGRNVFTVCFYVYFPTAYYIHYFYYDNNFFSATLFVAIILIVLCFLYYLYVDSDIQYYLGRLFESKEKKEKRKKLEKEASERRAENWKLEKEARERQYVEIEIPKMREELDYLNSKLRKLEDEEIYIKYDPQKLEALRNEKNLVTVRINNIINELNT